MPARRPKSARTSGPRAERSLLPEAEIPLGDQRFLRAKTRPIFNHRRSFRVVDLFAGCGGISVGVEQAAASHGMKLDIALAVEIDPVVRAVFQTNFPGALVDDVGDVTLLIDGRGDDILTIAERRARKRTGQVDLVVGGPPCQGNSNLNNHTRAADERNALYRRMARAAKVFEPACIAIENVPGVVRDQGRVVDETCNDLMRMGYRVDHGIVDLLHLGVPQSRVRHLMLAHRDRQPSVENLHLDHLCFERTLEWAIRDLERCSSNTLFDTATQLSPDNVVRAEWLIAHDEYDLPNERRPKCHRDKPDHRYKSMYGRLAWSKPAQTITTGFLSPGQGRYLHPSAPRVLTPHEAARIQFFPDWFRFDAANSRRALAHCIGNAVPPKLGYALGRELLREGDSS
jgi:DNA (cytosine-5)-methyltransferase 1